MLIHRHHVDVVVGSWWLCSWSSWSGGSWWWIGGDVVVARRRGRTRGGGGRAVELRLGGGGARRGEPEIELRGRAAVEIVARDAGGGDGDRVRGRVRAARDDVPGGEARGRYRGLAREVVVPVVDLRVIGPVAAVEVGGRRRVAHRGRRIPEEVVPL